jgi:predicted aconitase with swiveling domain
MKTFVSTVVLVVAATVSFSALAEGSRINKSVLINASKNEKVLNAAIGEKSKANVGSMAIEGSRVNKSVLINASKNEKVLNAAIGKKSEANVGSMSIK